MAAEGAGPTEPTPPPAPDHQVVVLAGHVDHGKSTLLRALTGMRTDRLAEERRRQLTIELGFVWTTLPGPDARTVAFVDVPGHERFVGTMLAGAGAAPAALLVVAADDGIAAQTREHLDVLALLGVPLLAVALTKADLVDPARLVEVHEQLASGDGGSRPLLAGVAVIDVDGVSGRGLDELRGVLARRLTALLPPEDRGRARLWVDRVFTVAGAGTVVTGTLRDGTLHRDDVVAVLPSAHQARVRGLQALERDLAVARPGMRVAVNLAGIAHDQVARGDVVAAGGPWRCTSQAELWVRSLPPFEVTRAGAWRAHVGTASVGCRLWPVADPIAAGDQGAVRIALEHPLPLVVGDGVVLRESGRRATIAGGVVAEPAPSRVRGRAARLDRAALLAEVATATSLADRLVALVRLAGGWRCLDMLAAVTGLPPAQLLAAVPSGADDRGRRADLVVLGDHLVDADIHAGWVDVLDPWCRTPADRAAVVAHLHEHGAPRSVAGSLVDALVASGRLVATPAGLVTAAAAPALLDEQQRRMRAVVAALAAAPFTPPDFVELCRAHGLGSGSQAALLAGGQLVEAGGVVFAKVAVDAAITRLDQLEAVHGPFTVSQARQVLGSTRRFTVPLLEHLDRVGITTRDGDRRRLCRT